MDSLNLNQDNNVEAQVPYNPVSELRTSVKLLMIALMGIIVIGGLKSGSMLLTNLGVCLFQFPSLMSDGTLFPDYFNPGLGLIVTGVCLTTLPSRQWPSILIRHIAHYRIWKVALSYGRIFPIWIGVETAPLWLCNLTSTIQNCILNNNHIFQRFFKYEPVINITSQ